ncbi:MAG: hypothetical protein Q7S53_02015 [bacterium]|nr:hypothetical protein [bacterium]
MKIIEISSKVARVEQMVYCKESDGSKIIICDPEGNIVRNPVSHKEMIYFGQEAGLFVFDLPVKDGFYVSLWLGRIYNDLFVLKHPLTEENKAGDTTEPIFNHWSDRGGEEKKEELEPFRSAIMRLRDPEKECYHCELVASIPPS